MNQLETSRTNNPDAFRRYQARVTDLRNNPVWQLIVADGIERIECWTQELKLGLKNSKTGEDLSERLRGGIMALEGLLALPQAIEEYEFTQPADPKITPFNFPTNKPVV